MNAKHETKPIALENLDAATVQPPWRTQDGAALARLQADLESGVWVPPAVVPGRKGHYVIGDGHRRVAAARALGLREVECTIYYGVSAEVLFALLNRDSQTIDGRSWLAAWARLGKGEREAWRSTQVPVTQASNIAALVELVGEKRAVELGLSEGGVSPAIAKRARQAEAWIQAYGKLSTYPKAAVLLEWALRHRASEALRHLAGHPPIEFARKLVSRVQRDLPFPEREWHSLPKAARDSEPPASVRKGRAA